MLDLIPIGTINRKPDENNAEKIPQKVKQVEATSKVANYKPSGAVRSPPLKNRRKRYVDRRRGRSKLIANRRLQNDRRLSSAINKDVSEFTDSVESHCGQYIDEEV